MNDTFSEVIKAARLVSLPDIYLRLRTILADPEFTMAEVAVVISRDPAITLRLLRLVNSSFYSFSSKVETVSRAVVLLGTRQVHDLVLATSVVDTFGMKNDIVDMYDFWWRSVRCAVASRWLAALVIGCDMERLFVAGLLHDIGHMIMYRAHPELMGAAVLTARERGKPLHEMEREVLGFDYTAVGGELMRQWCLPESLWETTMFHNEPDKAGKYPRETGILHLAVLLTRAGSGEGVFNEGFLTAHPSVWSVTGLTPQACIALFDQIDQETTEIADLIFTEDDSVVC